MNFSVFLNRDTIRALFHGRKGSIGIGSRDSYQFVIIFISVLKEAYERSSPVSRTTEPLRNQGFRFLYVRKYPNRTQTIPNHAIFSMKACILFDDSRRIVSVTCPYRSRVNAAE